MNVREITDQKIQKILRNHVRYDFPMFLQEVRKIYGKTIKEVSGEMGISRSRLFHLENGRFTFYPKKEQLEKISSYYCIPNLILEKKCKKFMEQQKNVSRNEYKNSRKKTVGFFRSIFKSSKSTNKPVLNNSWGIPYEAYQ